MIEPNQFNHKLLKRQLRSSILADGQIDYARLMQLIEQAYQEFDTNQRRVDRANRLMIEELQSIVAEREAIAEERAERVAELEAAHSALEISESRARHLAFHDVLTGLPNRALLAEKLNLKPQQNSSIAIHCLDLDHFKNVNDTFGHHAGDELIQRVASVLTDLVETPDLVARLGGDEFAIVQFGACENSAAALAEMVISRLGLPFNLSFGRVHIGCSIGIAMLDSNATEPMEALRQADLALYAAKGNGRAGHQFFEAEMDAAVRMQQEISEHLRTAIESGQIQLAYQPQVDVSGSVIGLEALARWIHPKRGNIPPSIFVPIAEERGLMTQLGLHVLEQAFSDARRWPKLRIAINVSALQLRSQSFVPEVRQLVRKYDVDPTRFELELTESVLLGKDETTLTAINRLKRLGFSIVLDDFGTGYSSLSYLREHPVSKIKIDRSFIGALDSKQDAEAFVSAIIKLADSLDLSVVAEGIETADQWNILSQMGCPEGQGYHFSKPISADEIDNLFGELAQPSKKQCGLSA
jgi:diguanylate cyclase (GGDEF)-like protein